MENKSQEDITKVYVYNRLNHKITECDVIEIDSCCFAKFYYYLEGSINQKWHYDLRNGIVRMLESDFYSSPTNHVLVSSDKRSLIWIRDSDIEMQNRLKDNILKAIKEIM